MYKHKLFTTFSFAEKHRIFRQAQNIYNIPCAQDIYNGRSTCLSVFMIFVCHHLDLWNRVHFIRVFVDPVVIMYLRTAFQPISLVDSTFCCPGLDFQIFSFVNPISICWCQVLFWWCLQRSMDWGGPFDQAMCRIHCCNFRSHCSSYVPMKNGSDHPKRKFHPSQNYLSSILECIHQQILF